LLHTFYIDSNACYMIPSEHCSSSTYYYHLSLPSRHLFYYPSTLSRVCYMWECLQHIDTKDEQRKRSVKTFSFHCRRHHWESSYSSRVLFNEETEKVSCVLNILLLKCGWQRVEKRRGVEGWNERFWTLTRSDSKRVENFEFFKKSNILNLF
jgi:hypothetical protein